MKEEELKQLIQSSSLQTSEAFTDRLMEQIEAIELEKEFDLGQQLSRNLWLLIGLTLVLSFCFGLYLFELKSLFILAMGGLMLALNRMLYLKQAFDKLQNMPC